jgi:hypothetical protein
MDPIEDEEGNFRIYNTDDDYEKNAENESD